MKNHFILALILCVITYGCTKIENLDSDNAITSYELLTHTPENILLGDLYMSGDTIYIPVEFGKYNFPLNISLKVEVPVGAVIYGFENGAGISFDTIDSEALRFVVSAENGSSKNYYIALLEEQLDENTNISDNISFIDSRDLLLYDRMISGGSIYKKIVAVDTKYPLEVVPMFHKSETTEIRSYREIGSELWLNYDNGSIPFIFENSEAAYELEVVAQSGWIEIWKIGSTIVDLSPIDQTMQIDYQNLGASINQEGISINRFDIDFDNGIVKIVVQEEEGSAAIFPMEIFLDVPTNEWLNILGWENNSSNFFDTWDDELSLVLFDPNKLIAVRWIFGIEKYISEDVEVLISEAVLKNFNTGSHSSMSIIYDYLTPSTSKPTPIVNDDLYEVYLYYNTFYDPNSGDLPLSDWWAEYELTLKLNDGSQVIEKLRWEANKNADGIITKEEIQRVLASTQYVEVRQKDGSIKQWPFKLLKDDAELSTESEILGLSINNTIPNYITFEDPPYYINNDLGEVILNIGTRYDFPMSISVSYLLSPFASIDKKELNFDSAYATQNVVVTAQDGVAKKTYTIRLNVQEKQPAPQINSISIGELPENVKLMAAPSINKDQKTILIPIMADNSDFPLNIPIINVDVEEGGSLELPSSAGLDFSAPGSILETWVSSKDGLAREKWSFEIYYYEQIVGGNMNNWEFYQDPITISTPWATPNMGGFARVENTIPTYGNPAGAGEYAAQMETSTTFGQVASGSVFTGWFDKSNSILFGLTDPTRLTHFGIPFSADAKIKGIRLQVSYSQAPGSVDWGSVTLILINEGSSKYVFHGNKPKDSKDPSKGSIPHPRNTATAVATVQAIFGNGDGKETIYGDPIYKNLEPGKWYTEEINISTNEPFTHISIAAASSAYGNYFIGQPGSKMIIDNVEILYE